MMFLGGGTDANDIFFNNNTPNVGLPEDTVKFYTPVGGSPYNNVNVCTRIVGSTKDNV